MNSMIQIVKDYKPKGLIEANLRINLKMVVKRKYRITIQIILCKIKSLTLI